METHCSYNVLYGRESSHTSEITPTLILWLFPFDCCALKNLLLQKYGGRGQMGSLPTRGTHIHQKNSSCGMNGFYRWGLRLMRRILRPIPFFSPLNATRRLLGMFNA